MHRTWIGAVAMCLSMTVLAGECPDETEACVCATLATLGVFDSDGQPRGGDLFPVFLVGEMVHPRIVIGANGPQTCASFIENFGMPPCEGCHGTVLLHYPDGSTWPEDGTPLEHGPWGFGCVDHPAAYDVWAPAFEACQTDGICRHVLHLEHSGVMNSPNPCTRNADVVMPYTVIDVDANDDGIVDVRDLVAVVCCEHETRCNDECDIEDIVDVILHWGMVVPIPSCSAQAM